MKRAGSNGAFCGLQCAIRWPFQSRCCSMHVQAFSCKTAISSKRHAGNWVDDTLVMGRAAADECAEASPPLQQLAAPPAQLSLPHVVQASGKVRFGAPSMQHRASATCRTNASGAGSGDPEHQLFELAVLATSQCDQKLSLCCAGAAQGGAAMVGRSGHSRGALLGGLQHTGGCAGCAQPRQCQQRLRARPPHGLLQVRRHICQHV